MESLSGKRLPTPSPTTESYGIELYLAAILEELQWQRKKREQGHMVIDTRPRPPLRPPIDAQGIPLAGRGKISLPKS
jgi:hypothetical protein